MNSDHFSSIADRYVRFRPHYPAELFAYLAQISLCQTAWDCGTGNGQAAAGLAKHFHKVWASDLSLAQIRQAAQQPNIEYFCSSAEQAPLPDASVDLICVGQAWHWFDAQAFESEAQRVLRPHGHVAIWCYNLMRIAPEIDRLIDDYYYNTIGSYWPPERHILEQGYPGFPQQLNSEPAPRFHMSQQWNLEDVMGYLSSWSATQYYQQAGHEDPLPQLANQLREVWGDGSQTRAVSWPLTLKIARKH